MSSVDRLSKNLLRGAVEVSAASTLSSVERRRKSPPLRCVGEVSKVEVGGDGEPREKIPPFRLPLRELSSIGEPRGDGERREKKPRFLGEVGVVSATGLVLRFKRGITRNKLSEYNTGVCHKTAHLEVGF